MAQNNATSGDFVADRAALSGTNFCSLWPNARSALQLLASVISNPLVKIAINTVVAAGNAYCGTTSTASSPAASYLSGDLTAGKDDCVCIAFTAVSTIGVDASAAAPAAADNVECICAAFTAVNTIGADKAAKTAAGPDGCLCAAFSMVQTLPSFQTIVGCPTPKLAEEGSDCLCVAFTAVNTIGADQMKGPPQEPADCICVARTVVNTLRESSASAGRCICAAFTAVNTLAK